MNADDEPVPAAAPPSRWRRWMAAAAAAGLSLWWLGSILLHSLIFGGLLLAGWMKPPSADPAKDDLHMTISPEHVRSIVADIRAQQKEQFAQRVREMAEIKAKLDALNTRKIEQFNALAREDARDAQEARQEVQKAVNDVRADQQAALTAQQSAAAAATLQDAEAKLAETPDDNVRAVARHAADEARQAVESSQAAAGQAQRQAAADQEHLAEQTARLGAAAKDARQAEEAAAAAQQQAEKQQEAADGNRDALAQDHRNVEQQSAAAQRDHAAADAAQEQVKTMESRVAQLQSAAPAPAPAPAPVTTPPAAETSPAAPVAQAPPAAQPAPPPAAQEAAQLTEQLPHAREQQQKASEQAANSAQALAAAQADAAAHLKKLQDDQSRAQQQQQAALDAQAKADAQIAAAVAAPPPPPLATAVATNEPPPAAPANADLAQLFQQAQQMEAAVAQSYKNVRAAELAAIRKIPVAQAAALTEVAKPTRDAIDTASLTRDIHDVQGVREQEHALAAASAQVDSMVALAQRMEALAQPAQDASLTVATLRTRAAQAARMEQLAMEDEGTKAKDLAATMQAADNTAGGGQEGPGDPGALARASAALAAAMVRLELNPLDPAALLEYQLDLAARQAGGAAGEQALAGAGNGRPGGRPGTEGSATPPEPPTLDVQHFKPIPGRTVSASLVATAPGRQADWMFVDSWYLIGPWPNPQRKNLDTKFPPESVVDLDATYTGGRQNEAPLPVHWQFYQASALDRLPGNTEGRTGMITPPGLGEFEIYYAYTELWFDEAGDYWVAIGSDDQSKVWVNDQMVWKSGDNLKGWAANEGLRRIHFRRGINRLLYRLENGWMSGGYSFMICLNGSSARPAPEARPAQGR